MLSSRCLLLKASGCAALVTCGWGIGVGGSEDKQLRKNGGKKTSSTPNDKNNNNDDHRTLPPPLGEKVSSDVGRLRVLR